MALRRICEMFRRLGSSSSRRVAIWTRCPARSFGWHHTAVLHQYYRPDDVSVPVPELRKQLNEQKASHAPRSATIDTESRLIRQLARSQSAEERTEALERAESLWMELDDATSAVPVLSRAAMRVALCSSMRRCALLSKNLELGELWTQRFSRRVVNMRPEDFMDQPNANRTSVPRESARPGTGIEQEDIDSDMAEEEAAKEPGKARSTVSPMAAYRQELMMNHPTIQEAFHRKEGPGPRYTG